MLSSQPASSELLACQDCVKRSWIPIGGPCSRISIVDFNSGPSFVLMSGNRVWIATISGTDAASASSSRRSFVTSWAFATISGTGIDTGACGAAPLRGVPGAGGVFCGASAGRTVAGAGEARQPHVHEG